MRLRGGFLKQEFQLREPSEMLTLLAVYGLLQEGVPLHRWRGSRVT